jgi:putative ATPase
MELFDTPDEPTKDPLATPLAERMRPQKLADVFGHLDVTGPESWLGKSLAQGILSPVLFWGPPGIGKTSLANVIANEFSASFIATSAVTAGVKEIREIIAKAEMRKNKGLRTVLFIDEIHRFNKGQQDALLHAVENGTIVLIGATTENPSFEINAPLLSRCQVIQLQPLDQTALKQLLDHALANDVVLQKMDISIESEELLFELSGGDARQLLNMLERAYPLAYDGNQHYTIARDILFKVAQKQQYYDKTGDYHYDTISAFIKSVRGSDADAAVFWLARMLNGGEDPVFIARRLIVLASEDIGNAEPYALSLAVAAFQAVQMIGMPEARIILSQVTTFLAACPKSNAAYKAIGGAMALAKANPKITVPLHLRNAPTKLMKDLGYGSDYKYPHDFVNHFVAQSYFPPEIDPTPLYEPGDLGREKKLNEYLQWVKKQTKGDD